jgi:hypothetical protein
MTELLYTAVKCKKMADKLNHFILSTRACARGAYECSHGRRRGTRERHVARGREAGRGGGRAGGGARPVREAGEAFSAGARETHWLIRPLDPIARGAMLRQPGCHQITVSQGVCLEASACRK